MQRFTRRGWMLVMIVAVCLASTSAAQTMAQTAATAPAKAQSVHADVVIYGGTAAAVTAAVQARRSGRRVVIVCPDLHLGGLTSGGLGWTDTGNKNVIGGLAKEFYQAVYAHYENDAAWRQQTRDSYGNRAQGHRAAEDDTATMWVFEPHVAEAILDRWIARSEIAVYPNHWLDRENGVAKTGPRITSIKTLNGATFHGRVFIDATYEGDLIAAAGIATTTGRESMADFGEPDAGVQLGRDHHSHHFQVLDGPVDPYRVPGDRASGLLPLISPDPPGEHGSGDDRIQAYCYRMCLTDDPDNRVPFAKPDGYDPDRYELLIRCFEAGWRNVFRKFDPLPNRKTDTNNHGPVSFDHIGGSRDYPEASYERRREIIADHQRYQKGMMYFIANDPRVPAEIRDEMNRWGLPRDEFRDNDHWPHQLYVREARRMVGSFVMTQNHLQKRIPTPEGVGMGSYSIDSHNVQRYVDADGHVQNEGDIGVSTNGPYTIAMGSLLPRADQCDNLVSPVCVSCTHMAFGSIRMEPVFMILGQSAATIADIAVEKDLPVQRVDYASVRAKLLGDGQILETPTSASRNGRDQGRREIAPAELDGVTVDDAQAIRTGMWVASRSSAAFVATGYRHDDNRRDGQSTATFQAVLAEAGVHEVRLIYPPNANRSRRTRAEIVHSLGRTVVVVDQTRVDKSGETSIPSRSLGRFTFTPEQPAAVIIDNADVDGYVVIDAVNFRPADATPAIPRD